MHKILKKYYIAMMIFLIPNILICFSCTYRTNYSVTSPGGVSFVDDRFEVDNGYDSNNLLSLYVYSLNNTTIFQNIIANLYDIYTLDEVSDNYSHMTDAMWYQAGVIQKNQSEESSVINAYTSASKINSSIKVEYDYVGVIVRITTADNNVLNLGDIVTHVNDIQIESLEHYLSIERTTGTKLTLIRNEQTINIVLGEDDVWLAGYYDKFNIKSTTPSYKLNSTASTGPSAGMMQTLSIYNQLISNDITVKDGVSRVIAGTGTIESDGSIGAIGGVPQKVYSAFNSGADILIMSIDNEEEALLAYNSLKNKERMKLIIVSSFDEVLSCLA